MINATSKMVFNNDDCVNVINDNNNGANCDSINRIDESKLCSKFENENAKNDKNNDDYKINIYRYKFSEEFTSILYTFSKIHQYDHRKDFKEAWNNWVEENGELVDIEVRRLSNIGYDGDIIDKMFKSARYYFRKKSAETKTPQKRRNYISIQKELIYAMDEHIRLNVNNDDYKPSIGFDLFCKENIELLKKEVVNLCNNGLKDHNEIRDKIKKTYKNRYFISLNK